MNLIRALVFLRMRPLALLGRVTVATFLLLLCVGKITRAQISPGPLAKAHESLNGPTQCTTCHAFGKGTASLKCTECHTEIAQELAQGRGLHARFSNKEDCAKCHSDHNGADFPLIHWVPSQKEFDHKQTGYVLEGKHAGIDCNRCHMPARIGASVKPQIKMKELRRSFLGLSQECVSCHEDPHKGQLGQNCTQCHNFADWKVATKIDHNKTRFPLTGLHAHVPCAKCHTPVTPGSPARLTGILFAKCSDCHADAHHGAFPRACETCHTTSGWKKIPASQQFDHSKTKYPLLGKHVEVDCLKCHAGGNFKKPVAFEKCSDCHTPDPHSGQFAKRQQKGECAECHTVEGWKPSGFGVLQHRTSAYPLDGKHISVPCAKCHVPAGAATRYKVAFANCLDCHADVHGGQFAKAPYNGRCEPCHVVAGFQPSTYSIAQHQKSRYPLAGAHLAITCGECHTKDRVGYSAKVVPYQFEDRTCTGCHKDPHNGQFKDRMAEKGPAGTAKGCEACHSLKSWMDLPGFDHSKTSFPLIGAHIKLQCDECHKPAEPGGKLSAASFKTAPTACSGCHEDIHAGQFTKSGQARKCEECHNSNKWKPSLFNHETQTDFSLKGAHEKVACDQCHKGFRVVGAKRVLFYKPTPRRCVDCHN